MRRVASETLTSQRGEHPESVKKLLDEVSGILQINRKRLEKIFTFEELVKLHRLELALANEGYFLEWFLAISSVEENEKNTAICAKFTSEATIKRPTDEYNQLALKNRVNLLKRLLLNSPK